MDDPFFNYLKGSKWRQNLTEEEGVEGDLEIRTLLEDCGLKVSPNVAPGIVEDLTKPSE